MTEILARQFIAGVKRFVSTQSAVGTNDLK